MKERIIYYEDELNDEFSPMKLVAPKIDGSYDYLKKYSAFARFFGYRVVAYPIAFLYSKIVFGRKIVGKKKLKPYKKAGVFLYGNHTQPTGDALMQACLTYPRRNYVIVHPNNLVVPVIGRFTPLLGALPLPDDMTAYRNFKRAIETRSRENHPIVIYPEAHIWPWYTGVRPFTDVSFGYPVALGAPCFAFTNTYRKGLFGRAKIVTYIDGPFFPDASLDARSARKKLRDEVYGAMTARAESSDYVRIKYVKRENQ